MEKIIILYIFLSVCFLTSCLDKDIEEVLECDTNPIFFIDLGSISDSKQELIPYEDSIYYYFKHSNGAEIQYITSVNDNYFETRTDECSDTSITFYSKKVTLYTSYPVFNFVMTMDQSTYFSDTIYVTLNGSIYNQPKIKIPLTNDSSLLKKLTIENKTYSGIHAIKYSNPSFSQEDSKHRS